MNLFIDHDMMMQFKWDLIGWREVQQIFDDYPPIASPALAAGYVAAKMAYLPILMQTPIFKYRWYPLLVPPVPNE